MRALLDANVLISALLAFARPARTITRIVVAGLRQAYTLLLPQEVVDEVLTNVSAARSLAGRISAHQAHAFVDSLTAAAEPLPSLPTAPPAVTRDPKDDYLLAQALAGHADYLVTGDKDLLALADRAFPFKIVTPAEFLAVLEEAGLA